MMIPWWEHSQKGVTDRQTDGRTEQFLSCLVAAKNIINTATLNWFWLIAVTDNFGFIKMSIPLKY